MHVCKDIADTAQWLHVRSVCCFLCVYTLASSLKVTSFPYKQTICLYSNLCLSVMPEGGMYSVWIDRQSVGKMSRTVARTCRNVSGILLLHLAATT